MKNYNKSITINYILVVLSFILGYSYVLNMNISSKLIGFGYFFMAILISPQVRQIIKKYIKIEVKEKTTVAIAIIILLIPPFSWYNAVLRQYLFIIVMSFLYPLREKDF